MFLIDQQTFQTLHGIVIAQVKETCKHSFLIDQQTFKTLHHLDSLLNPVDKELAFVPMGLFLSLFHSEVFFFFLL
jgi:hypothetical protein